MAKITQTAGRDTLGDKDNHLFVRQPGKNVVFLAI